jgi:hypothetical protein
MMLTVVTSDRGFHHLGCTAGAPQCFNAAVLGMAREITSTSEWQ